MSQSLIGRTVPTGYPCGGTITIVGIEIHPSFTDGLPVISCELKWDTGNSILDTGTTLGSLAPGTMLWDALNNA